MFALPRPLARLRDLMPRAAASPSRTRVRAADGPLGRDLRIDLIRGLALWMIFADHIPGDVLGHLTYRHFALSDALDVFVFLSGISCCLLYGRLIRTAGFVRAQIRASQRACQLYGAYLVVGVATVACYLPFRGMLDDGYIAANDLTFLAADPLRAISAMLWLFYTPQFMDILPLYVVLVCAAPAMILLMGRSEAATLAASAALWTAAALLPQVNVPSLDSTGFVSLNPFSWQLLFCIGLWTGKRHFIDGARFRPMPSLQAVCWAIVVAGFAARHADWFGYAPLTELAARNGGDHETNDHVARLANLLATAYLVASYLRADAPLLRSKWLKPLRLCGRHSLEVFCAGVVLSLAGTLALRAWGEGAAVQIAINVASLAAMTAVASLREGRRRKPLPASDSLAIDGMVPGGHPSRL